MCTSVISNRKKTLIGWNLDLLDMPYRVRPDDRGVYIEVLDAKEGWMPLFGANSRGDFVGMPTCWPYDARSDPRGSDPNVILLDIDLLLQKKTLAEVRHIAETERVCSVPGLTFTSALSDRDGNALHVVPGQGTRYFARPRDLVLTNFSPFKQARETHPWMGMDRFRTAERILASSGDDFDVDDCFALLRAVSQTVCPTVVSMVFDPAALTVWWCENRRWDEIKQVSF